AGERIAPRAELDNFSTLDAGRTDLAYEEAWDLKLQRKLNLPASVEEQSSQHLYVNEDRPSVGIQRNPESSAFRSTKPAPPQQMNLFANLTNEGAHTEVPPVPKHESSDAARDLPQNPWYHTGLNRNEAEDLLTEQPEGTFLIRPSETKQNEYALSIAHEGNVTHMLIAQNENGKYVLGRYSSAYDSIQAMVGTFLSRELRVQNSSVIRLTRPYISPSS
ncbi:hypothetical protein Ciccas_013379, partial [Cichlidogyrus casuarinus]